MKHVAVTALLPGATAIHRPRAVRGVFADVGDPKKLIAELHKAFEDFKAENDARLKAKADVVLDEKVERINTAVGNVQAAIDEINARVAAAAVRPAEERRVHDREYTDLWSKFFRHGDDEQAVRGRHNTGLRAAMSVGSNPDGGYLAPVEWDRTVTGRLKEVSPIRQNAKVQSISGPGFRKVFTDRAVGSGWVGETAARPATATPQFTVLDFVTGEMYAFPQASQTILEDAEIDLEAWLAGEVETEFSRQENIAFLSGDGVNKPFGLLTYITGAANAAKHPWGAIQVVNSGAAAALTSDGFIDLFYSVPTSYRQGAKLYTNRLSQAAMRKLKDGQGNYLWQPSYVAGQPATLAGEAIVEVPDMPAIAAGAIAALYGNMSRGYLVVDRVGIQVLRDPYSNKPFVGFYTRKRVGGGVVDPDALKALKISA